MAQALLVTCSVDFPKITVTNHSAMPVLGIEVLRTIVKGSDDLIGWVSQVPQPNQLRKPLGAGESWTVTAESQCHRVGDHLKVETRNIDAGDEFHPEFHIVDATGLQWERFGNLPPRLMTFPFSLMSA
ncbi:hypothetical protein OG864_00530 [Streptomyces sp. NBC_00124]|nr:hypothetical protein [Streptomyces sp. NBC_00124]